MKKLLIVVINLLFFLITHEVFAADGLVRYTVIKGDSLSKIALKYHQPTELISVINNISDSKPIHSGEILLIPIDPAAESIVLKKGDNPWDIAKKYGISAEKLLAANDISNPTRLMPGEVLAVPLAQDTEDPDTRKKSVFSVATKSKIRKPRMRLSYRDETKFIWPVAGPISSGYGTRWGNDFHHGLDIAADYGTNLVAAIGGKVIEAGYKNSIYGNTVMIESDTYTLLYAHLSKIIVNEGDVVSQGQAIGQVGDSGRTTGPHLHLEVRTSEGTLNPLRFLP